MHIQSGRRRTTGDISVVYLDLFCYMLDFFQLVLPTYCLRFFDAVGWAAERASGL